MKTLFLALLLCLSLYSIAQKQQSSISIGPSIGIPSNFRGPWGSGASIRGYIGTSKRSSVLVNTNTIFYPSNYKGNARTVSMLKLGYKTQLFNPDFFVYADAGVAFNYGYSWSNGSDPAAAIGFGYSLPIGERKYLDVVPGWNFKLRNYPNPWLIYSSRFELHFAYRFALK